MFFSLLYATLFFASVAEGRSSQQRDFQREFDDSRKSAAEVLTPYGQHLERKETSLFLHRGSDVPPAEQLSVATSLEAEGKWNVAAKAYDTLVRSYPFALQASTAQLRLGYVLEKMGKYADAFREYNYMLVFYPEVAPSHELLMRMYTIADYYYQKGKVSRALEYLHKIAELAPKWSKTPDVLLLAGKIELENEDFFEAAESFDTISNSHLGSEAAKEAIELQAIAVTAMAKKRPNDDAITINAINLTASALKRGRENSPLEDILRENLVVLTEARAKRFFEQAQFYDKKGVRPEVAVAAYRDFVRRFPTGPFTELAEKRINFLQSQTTIKE